MKSINLILTFVLLTQLSISLVNCQNVYHQNEEVESIRPKTDWREVIAELAGPLWCDAKLTVKALWCAGTSAYEWLEMGIKQTDRQFCCYMFDTSNCIASAAKKMCSQKDYQNIVEFLYTKNNELRVGRCSAYGFRWYDWRTLKCHFPWIPICATIGVSLTTILVMSFVIEVLANHFHFLRHNWGDGHRLGRL